jgi:sugar/nucleoside kinase (ribokinase family)
LSPPDVAPAGAGLDLVVAGDCNPDVLVLGGDVTPAFGQQEKLVDSISLVMGGSAAITAVAAARLGLRVALAAAVGDDPAGEFMLAQLAREGVDVSAVAVRAGVPTGMTVALSRAGDRAILTALGAVASLTAADIPRSLLARARHVHASSYFLLAGSLGPGLADVLADARTAGATTSLDTNWDPCGRWGDERLSAAIAQADVLLPNEAEALRLTGTASLSTALPVLLKKEAFAVAGTPRTIASPPLNGPSPAQAMVGAAGTIDSPQWDTHDNPVRGGGPRVAVKLGERGALCADETGWYRVSLPPVVPVDATGAGDCFDAGLIAGLLTGHALPDAAALGCAAGALSTGAAGGTGSAPDMAHAAELARLATIAAVRPPGRAESNHPP